MTSDVAGDGGSVLCGRDEELAALSSYFAGISERGGVLAVRGGAGIGKSSLLSVAAATARARGVETVSVVAVQAEVRIPFAAAHTLLTLLGGTEPTHADGKEHYHFQLALALLAAATSGSQRGPLLIIVDDAQWLDTPSWEALAFVGRRLAQDPVMLVLVMRDSVETETRLSGLRVPELRVEPLSDAASLALLNTSAPDLAVDLRTRVLSEARGNPLAITELSVAATRVGAKGLLPAWLPLTERLERTFGIVAEELPQATRSMLVAAALDHENRLDEVIDACGRTLGSPVSMLDLEPAVMARLVDVDNSFHIRFRHPLIRSAIYHQAPLSLRQQIHAALSCVVSDEDRALRHRAASTVGPDAAVAGDLDLLASRLRMRGAADEAAQVWEQAGRLAASPRQRASLLLRALEVTMEGADHEQADRLMSQITPRDLGLEDQVVLQWLKEVEMGGWSGATRLPAHLAAARRLHQSGQDERALYVLHRVAVRTYFSTPTKALRDAIVRFLEGLDLPPLTPRLVATLGLVAPVERGPQVVERMNELLGQPGLTGADLGELAAGATAVGALGQAARFATEAVAENRREGNLMSLTWSLAYQAWAAVQRGDASLARTAAAEADALAVETRQHNYIVPNMLNWAHAEALRGNSQAVRDLTERSERALLANGAHSMLCLVKIARGVGALAVGDYEEAYNELDAVFTTSKAGYHPDVRCSLVAHLAEAGAHCGRHKEVAERIKQLAPIATSCISPQLRVHLHCATALIATGPTADESLRQALETDLTEWPFDRARLQLAYGTLLRRARPSTARPMLRAAAETFDALGARPWAERANAELRASGETRTRATDGVDRLTPQELQVARLVVEGLTNREIAARLFLSPRTISTHLYRIYPKIGITSRVELAAAMASGYVT